MKLLISKDESIENSIIFLAYNVLKKVKKQEIKELPIYNFFKFCRDAGTKSYDEVMNVLCFLFSVGLIEFKEPNICLT